jgi:DNA-binding transcriptional regulator YiaG
MQDLADPEAIAKDPLNAGKRRHRAQLPDMQEGSPVVGLFPMAATTTAGRITQMREAAGLSKRKLATLANVDPRLLNRWEDGTHEPQVPSIRKLIPHIGGSIDFFLGDTTRDKPPRC